MLKFFKSILQFIGFIFKYAFGVAFGLLFFVLIVSAIAYLFSPSETVGIKSNSVLKLTLSQPILERSVDNPLSDLGLPIETGANGIGLMNLKDAIRKAKKDDNIKGIFLYLSSTQAGFATLQEIRDALLDFKKSKKFIYAYGEYYSEGAYYLASVADKIFLNPNGDVELNGLTANRSFYKGALEKLEIKAEVFKVGEFKSAVEPFLLDKMSEANRKQTLSYLNSIYDFYLENVAKSRNIPLAELTKISDSLLIREAEDALRFKVVTQIAYYDEVEADLKKTLKLKEKDKIEFVELAKYENVEEKDKPAFSSNKIAVIVGQGEIGTGKGDESSIGSTTIIEELKKARDDKNVKAIVLRINSPGGSALASDLMWREIELTKKVKPIIASMSDVAASGGYYMAMACDQIVAQPNTITGSIGIFGMLFNLTDFYKNKMGITSDYVSTGKFADLSSALLDRDLTEEEKKIIQTSVNKGYEEFTSKAAKGRKMTIEKLKSVASGRVWSGIEAKANGLVDVLGSFDDAVKLAAQKAKLKEGDYRLRFLPVEKKFFDKISEMFNTKAQEKILKERFGEFFPYFKLIEQIKGQDFLQAKLPYSLEVK